MRGKGKKSEREKVGRWKEREGRVWDAKRGRQERIKRKRGKNESGQSIKDGKSKKEKSERKRTSVRKERENG